MPRAVFQRGAVRRPRPARRWAALLAGPASLLLAVSGCQDEQRAQVVQAPPVLVEPVQLRDVTDRIEATGQLLARSDAEVAAQVAGQVTRLYVDEGASVDKGQVIVDIDPQLHALEVANQRAMVAEAEAQLAEARRENTRVERMRERGAASQADTDEAQTQLELAQARLEASRARLGLAQRALTDSSVVAPFGGRVARRYVSEGEFVSKGTLLFDLVALEDMEVEFHLAERDSGRVTLGDRVDVRVAPFPDEVFPATVTVVSPTIDPRTRTLRVKARVDNKEGRLRPGLFARADLGISQRDGVIMIPEEALLLRADGTVVYRMSSEDEVERVAIQTGVRREGLIEVVEGLSATDRVVVRGQSLLVDGAVVDVRTAEGEKPANVAAGSLEESSS